MRDISWFLVACAFGLMANFFLFYIRFRLRSAGHILPYPVWLRDLQETIRLYSVESTKNNWSVWPLYFFWISSGGAAIFISILVISEWGVLK